LMQPLDEQMEETIGDDAGNAAMGRR